MGQADEKVPAVILRGLNFEYGEGDAHSIIRDDSENLFS